MKNFFFVSFLFIVGLIPVYPNDGFETDSSEVYIENLTHLLNLKLYTITRSNTVDIIYPEGRINMRPNGNTNIGIGFNYKSLGLGISFGRPLRQSSIQRFGMTNRFVVQGSYFGRRIGLDGFIQGYQGYYMVNPQDFIDWNENYQPQVSDLKVYSIGGNGFYIINGKKFSYKAAYLRNEIQKKSAGSLTAGFFVYFDAVDSDKGLIPQEMPDSIRNDFNLKSFDATSIGISLGYLHTFVIKQNFFINISVIPGLGFRRLSANSLDGAAGIANKLAAQLQARGAMGYEFKNFYLGAQASLILRSFTYKEYKIDLGTEQFRFMIGKRF